MPNQQILCKNCAQINLPDLKSAKGYVHAATCAVLVGNAESCRLCKIITKCLRRSIYHNRNINNPQRTLDDILTLGPVRMFAAGKDIGSISIPRRQAGRIEASQLARLVKISVGEVDAKDILLYDSRSAVLEMFADEGTLITAPAQIQISRPTSDQPLSTASLVLLQSWLSECFASHTLCGTSLSLDKMRCESPTRLVDVSFDEAGRVRLIETQGLRLNYVAMSYCWGAHHAGKKTTRGTIAEMKRGIRPGELTRTIQDAITVVRALQIRYLWVDALCIIQGDEADWQREASMMGMIYANADFTIAATRAMASSEGFLQSRAEHTAAFTLPGSAATIVFRESLDTAEEYLEQVYDSPLLARAWVMQERALSRRTVDFTTKKMFLTCRQGILTEDGVRTTHHETASSNFTKILDLLCMPSLTDAVRDIWTNQFFSVWAELIQWYMTREITHTKDRLPAVAGMANLASTVLPGKYLHGLWEINLADGLFWQPLHRPMVQDPNEEASSWSWASAASEVILSGHNPNESLITFIALSDCQRMLTIKGHIQKCLVSLLANAPEPPCRSERKLRDPPIAKDFYTFHLRSAVGPRVVGSTLNNVCLFDRIRGDGTDFYYVDLSVSHHGTTMWRGLLLQKPAYAEDSPSYNRIGVCWSDDRLGHRVRPTAFSIL